MTFANVCSPFVKTGFCSNYYLRTVNSLYFRDSGLFSYSKGIRAQMHRGSTSIIVNVASPTSPWKRKRERVRERKCSIKEQIETNNLGNEKHKNKGQDHCICMCCKN